MPRLLIVAHCPSKNAERMRDAVVEGARCPEVDGVEVQACSPFEADADTVLGAHGYILGTTENFGYMNGALKDFFERIYHPCLDHTQGRPWALWVKAGQDGQGAITSVERIVQGLRWRAVQAPLLCVGPPDDAVLADCHELGLTLAAGLETGIF